MLNKLAFSLRLLPRLWRWLGPALGLPLVIPVAFSNRCNAVCHLTGTPNMLNTLAFSPRLLPRLWRWLGPALGLPLEAPLSATRGLDVSSLAHGFRDIPRPKALVLGLFCRCVEVGRKFVWKPVWQLLHNR